MIQKKRVTVEIALHPIQADIIIGLQEGKIDLSKYSLRDIGKVIKVASPQKIKHHLEALVKLGVINIINSQYSFTK